MKKTDSKQQKIRIFVMISILLGSTLLAGCAGAFVPTTTTAPSQAPTPVPTPKPSIDEHLVGDWTNEPGRLRIILDSQGKPGQPVPIGEWYVFDPEGRYYRVARFMTFAIGGIMVEEGSYEAKSGVVRLFNRTESFFPDEGSPQKAKFREPMDTIETYYYHLASEQSVDALFLKTSPSGEDFRFLRCAGD